MALYSEKLRALYPDAKPGDWEVSFNVVSGYALKWNRQDPAPSLAQLDALVPDVAIAKASASNQITTERNAALKNLTASWGADSWDADEATSARIANALFMVKEAAALGIQAPASIPWRTADNKDRVLTISELTQMGAAVFLAQQAVWAKQAQKKNAIAAAKDSAEVDAVKWDA